MCLHIKMVIGDWRHSHTHGWIWQSLQSSLAKTGCVNSQKECWTAFLSKLFRQHIENSTTPTFELHNLSFLKILNFRICVLFETWCKISGVWYTQVFELSGSWASHCSWQLGEKVDKYDWKQFLDCFHKTQCEHRGFGTLLVLWRYLLFLLESLLFVHTGARTDDPLLLTPGPHLKNDRFPTHPYHHPKVSLLWCRSAKNFKQATNT